MHWNNKVIWSEGMFLQPQHFQQHDRYVERLLEGRAGPLAGHAWGFVNMEVDTGALALGKPLATAQKNKGHIMWPSRLRKSPAMLTWRGSPS